MKRIRIRLLMVTIAFASILNLLHHRASAQTPQYGLEWPGDGSLRRMLYWHNPPPIYPMTYVFRVLPHKKTTGSNHYYTTFFWGNDGAFSWQNGLPNTYYGAHPYPVPAPSGNGQWEISVYSNDYVTGQEVGWDRWYTQVFRAWRDSSTTTRHEFYYDWPDQTKLLTKTIVDANWANQNPPVPAIVMGQAPDINGIGIWPDVSWGGYEGWEEFKGVIRGIQIYSAALTLTDVASEIASPQSSAVGNASMWYLNINPRPSDVTDKKAGGTPHHPIWDVNTALEWTDVAPPPDMTPPSVSMTAPATGSTVSGTMTVSASASDNVGVIGVRFLLDGANLGSEDLSAPYSISWNTTTSSNGPHGLTAVARDAAGNMTTSSVTDVTVNNVAQNPCQATPLTASVQQWPTTTSGAKTFRYTTSQAISPTGGFVFSVTSNATRVTFTDYRGCQATVTK